MRTFTFSDLSRRSGEVVDAAMVEPVSLLKRGKAKMVMLPADQYERLVRANEERTAFALAEAPAEDIDNVLAGFRQMVDDAERSSE